jgi:hypothetical protein
MKTAAIRQDYLVVHRCTARSRRKLKIALAAEKEVIKSEEKVEQARVKFKKARQLAFESIEKEYPEITNPCHPSKILARHGLVVIERPH